MVQIFVFFECTFRMRKFEHAHYAWSTHARERSYEILAYEFFFSAFWLIIRKFVPTKISCYTVVHARALEIKNLRKLKNIPEHFKGL